MKVDEFKLVPHLNDLIVDLLLGCTDNFMCIYAGKLIQEYQSIGTVEELRKLKEESEKAQKIAPETLASHGAINR